MKYIRLVSDIHLDFDIDAFNRSKFKSTPENKATGEMGWLWTPPAMEGDLDSTLVIAGDLWYERKFLTRKYKNGTSWMQNMAKQFKYVVFVLGNHDYWKTNLSTEIEGIKKELSAQELTNVFVLENRTLVLDNVKFLGGTLWTDYNEHNIPLMMDAPNLMNDYKKMRQGLKYGKAMPTHLYKIHKETKSYIFNNAIKDNPEQKLVVVTHMAPSEKSLEQRHIDNALPMNFLYVSNLEKEVSSSKIDLWFHGHLHEPVDYLLGTTRVISNPRGYVGEFSKSFNPEFRLEV